MFFHSYANQPAHTVTFFNSTCCLTTEPTNHRHLIVTVTELYLHELSSSLLLWLGVEIQIQSCECHAECNEHITLPTEDSFPYVNVVLTMIFTYWNV